MILNYAKLKDKRCERNEKTKKKNGNKAEQNNFQSNEAFSSVSMISFGCFSKALSVRTYTYLYMPCDSLLFFFICARCVSYSTLLSIKTQVNTQQSGLQILGRVEAHTVEQPVHINHSLCALLIKQKDFFAVFFLQHRQWQQNKLNSY